MAKSIFIGDGKILSYALITDEGLNFNPTGHSALYTLKRDETLPDPQASVQKTSLAGISFRQDLEGLWWADVEFLYADTVSLSEGVYVSDIQFQLGAASPVTIAKESLWLKRDVTRSLTSSIPINVLPPGQGGMANPMTSAGDLIVGDSTGLPTRLPVGTVGQFLGVSAGLPAWVAAPDVASLSTAISVEVATRASVDQSLSSAVSVEISSRVSAITSLSTAVSTSISTANSVRSSADVVLTNSVAAKMTNPMTTAGDLIYGGASGTPARLGAGTNGHVLTLVAGNPGWAPPSGGGTGTKTYAIFRALDSQPPATAFATFDTRNSIPVLDFDAATDETTVFSSILPEAASLASGLKVRLHWMADTATSGNVRWRVAFERCNTDLDADSFDTAVEANGTANATSGIPTITEITVTTIDSLTAGDLYRLRVTRVGTDATNDTMTGDAQLIAVEVRSAA